MAIQASTNPEMGQGPAPCSADVYEAPEVITMVIQCGCMIRIMQNIPIKTESPLLDQEY